MSGRRLSLAHVVSEDRGRESGTPSLSNNRGQMVQGFATFYITSTGWERIPPGRLDLSELHGGASGRGSSPTLAALLGVQRDVSMVEFYLNADGPVARNFVAVNASLGDVFTFGFFGRRFS